MVEGATGVGGDALRTGTGKRETKPGGTGRRAWGRDDVDSAENVAERTGSRETNLAAGAGRGACGRVVERTGMRETKPAGRAGRRACDRDDVNVGERTGMRERRGREGNGKRPLQDIASGICCDGAQKKSEKKKKRRKKAGCGKVRAGKVGAVKSVWGAESKVRVRVSARGPVGLGRGKKRRERKRARGRRRRGIIPPPGDGAQAARKEGEIA